MATLTLFVSSYPQASLFGSLVFLILLLLWLQIPKQFDYYMMEEGIREATFFGGNYLDRRKFGRIKVYRFCRKNGIKLHLLRKISLTLLDMFLWAVGIPDPMKYQWDGGFAATQIYPLTKTRRHWVLGCLKARWWPWKSEKTINRILEEHKGHMPSPLGNILFHLEFGLRPGESVLATKRSECSKAGDMLARWIGTL